MAVLPNVTEIVVEMSRRETTSRHKAKKWLTVMSITVLFIICAVFVLAYITHVIALRRVGKSWSVCLWEALTTRMATAPRPPPRAHAQDLRYTAHQPSSIWTRLTRVLSSKSKLRSSHPASSSDPSYAPYSIDIQRMGSQYRATSRTLHSPGRHAPLMMPFRLGGTPVRPPQPAYIGSNGVGGREASVTDLPSYGDANRDAPPKYDNDTLGEADSHDQEEITVEHNYVS